MRSRRGFGFDRRARCEWWTGWEGWRLRCHVDYNRSSLAWLMRCNIKCSRMHWIMWLYRSGSLSTHISVACFRLVLCTWRTVGVRQLGLSWWARSHVGFPRMYRKLSVRRIRNNLDDSGTLGHLGDRWVRREFWSRCYVDHNWLSYDSSLSSIIKIVGHWEMSHVMRKPVHAICEQQRRRSACASAQSDQRLCFRWLDSMIPLLAIAEISSPSYSSRPVCVLTGRKPRRQVFSWRGSYEPRQSKTYEMTCVPKYQSKFAHLCNRIRGFSVNMM